MKTIPKDMTVGTVHKTTNYGNLVIVNYSSKRFIEVEFLDTGYRCSTEAVQIRRGGVKDKMKPTVFGVGYIGGDKYTPKSNGTITKAYAVWQAMIRRCYSKVCLENQPTYKGCTVRADWHNFQIFAEWFYNNYKDDGVSYDLDKDIKIDGNKEYSSDSCMLVEEKYNIIKASAIPVTLRSSSGEVESFVSCAEACRRIGVSSAIISRLRNGKLKSAKGWTIA